MMLKLGGEEQYALCMTESRDFVNHDKNARNGKSMMKSVRMSILTPLTFKCLILERFESFKRIVCWMAKLATQAQQLFSI